MLQEHTLLSYTELLAALRQLSLTGQTGTMFIGTNDNHSVRFTLKKGEIVACCFGTKRGEAALAQVSEITSGKYSFTDAVFNSGAAQNMPSTQEVLSYLGVTLPETVTARQEPRAEPKPASDEGVAPDSVPVTIAKSEVRVLDIPAPDELMELLETELALFIGPLGPAVCAMHEEEIRQAKDVEKLSAVIEAISQEIAEPDRAEEFRGHVWDRLS
jgi:hypothetical protein